MCNEQEIEAPYFSLYWALVSTFTTSKYELLILKGFVMPVMTSRDGEFYAFDSQARKQTRQEFTDESLLLVLN